VESGPAGRWSPYVQLLVGGNKITHEQMLPERKRALELLAAQIGRRGSRV
jgi:hypothetical protein